MKKNLKLTILVMMSMLFLTGCVDWEDVQEDYGDILNTNPSCTYYTEAGNASNDHNGVEQFKLSADYNGIYFSVNNGGKNLIYGTDGGNQTITVNYYQWKFSDSFLEEYLTKYKNDGRCPETIYVPRNNISELRIYDCEGMDYYCDAYKLKSEPIVTPDGEKKDCHLSTATDCQKISKEEDNLGIKAYMEFGYYQTSSGVTKKYFGVSINKNYSGMIFDQEESDGFAVSVNGGLQHYEIPDAAISEIWLANGKFINNVIIKAAVVTNTIYYVTGTEATNPGNIDDVGKTEELPVQDEDEYAPEPYIPKLNLESPCSNEGIKNIFRLIGYLISVIKWIVPLGLIVFGMIDFGKAVIDSDENAVKKATSSFITRLVAAIVVFFIPTIILAILKGIEVTKGIEDDVEIYENSQFGQCTKCLFDPYKQCEYDGNGNTPDDGKGNTSDGGNEAVKDTTAPVLNYCQAVIKNNNTTYFYIDSKDTDIEKFVVNNNPNLTFRGNSTKSFTVNSELKNVKVTAYDTSNNFSSIKCESFYEQVKPSGSQNIKYKGETNTLKVAVELNERSSGLDYYTTYIWVKNANAQFKSEVNHDSEKIKLTVPEKLMNDAIEKNNLKNKLVVGINASGYEASGVYYGTPAHPLVLSNGVVIRDWTNKGLGTPKYNTYGINKDGILKYYPYGSSDHVKVANQIKNDGVKNTFGFVIRLVEDGKVVTSQSGRSVLQGVCQINENNFVFVTDVYGSSRAGFTYKELANYMVNLGCKTGYNMDGGGSTQLLFKPSNGNPIKLITQTNRAIPDIIYFHE